MISKNFSLYSSNTSSMGGNFTITATPNGAYDNSSTLSGTVALWRPNNLPSFTCNADISIYIKRQDTGEQVYRLAHYFATDVSVPAAPFNAIPYSFNNVVIPHRWNGSQEIELDVYVYIYAPNADPLENAIMVSLTALDKVISLDTISRFAWLTSAPDFTDLDNPTIYFTNPTGASNAGLMAGIYDINGIEGFVPYENVDPYANYHTFNLTEEQREKLRVAASSHNGSLPVLFYLTTWQPGGVNPTTLARTMTLAGDAPTLDIDLFDINEDAQSAIGNNTAILKGYNYVYYKINATPDEGATITSYTAKCGNTTLTTQEGYFENVESGDFTFTATDNRGRTKTETKSLTVIDYFKPTINQEVSIDLVEETSVRAFVKINGTFYNENFGNKTNQIKVSIRYHTGGDWTEWMDIQGDFPIPIEILYDGHNYSADFGLTFDDYTKAYTFQCSVADTLASYATTPEYTVKRYPVFDWSETDFNFNVPVKIDGNLEVTGELIVGGDSSSGDAVIETGTEDMGTNGTWYWSKWKSGKAECYGVRNFGNMAVGTAWGSDFYSNTTFNQPLPTGLFSEPPYVIDIHLQGNGTGSAWIAKNTMPTTTDTGGFVVMRSTSATLSQVYIGFNIIGRWK